MNKERSGLLPGCSKLNADSSKGRSRIMLDAVGKYR